MDLEVRLKAAAELVSEQSLRELVELVWTSDRHFTFPSFQATARHVGNKLREWDVRARTFELPADGKTVLGDWRMPLGWDCTAAHLELYEPFEERGRALGDFKKRPAHVIMWSGPTPPQGIIGEVVRIADESELETRGEALRHKIVYTPADPRPFKKRLADAGALAVVTSYCPNAHHWPQECGWINSWADDPADWAFHDGDAPLPGVVITPDAGVELEVLLDRGRVRVKLTVDSRYFEGQLPVICGYLDAGLQEEVVAVAHAFGHGANADASGPAVVLESLRALQEGTRTGALAPLRRAVRGLLVHRGCGLIGFCAQNPGILRRIQAGVNWAGLGRYQETAQAVFHYYRGPDACASVSDTLLLLLLEAWLPRALPHLRLEPEQPFEPVENVCNDPQIGIFCPAVAGRDLCQGTSADTPKDLSARTLHAFATVSVAYLHFLATATGKEAVWLAHQTIRRYGRQLEDLAGRYAMELEVEGADKPAILARAGDHLTYVRERCEAAVMTAKRFMLREERAHSHLTLLKLVRHTRRLVELEKRRLKELAGCEPGALPALEGLAELAELRPYRKFLGTPTYASVPASERGALGSPAADAALHAALFWADGERTFADILRRIGYEYPEASVPELVAHFRFMGEHALVQWLKPGEAVPKPPKPETREAAEEAPARSEATEAAAEAQETAAAGAEEPEASADEAETEEPAPEEDAAPAEGAAPPA